MVYVSGGTGATCPPRIALPFCSAMKRIARTAYNRLTLSLLCVVTARTQSHQACHRVHALRRHMSSSKRYPEPSVVQPASEHKSTVFIIHGLGDSGAGWVDFAPELSPGLPNTKFVFPNAPQLPVTLNGGMLMNSWYDLASLEKIDDKEDVENLHASADYIASLVQAEVSQGIDSKRVVVAGFSQGGALALLSLRQSLPLAGVLSMSGYLTLADDPLLSEANKGTPLLMCHGDADPVVAYRYGVETHKRLKGAGANVTFLTYPSVGHTLAPKEVIDVKAFLKSCLS